MENEARIRVRIRSALEPVTPAAPWLSHQIKAAIREESRNQKGGSGMVASQPRRWRLTGGLGAVAVAALAIALILGLGVWVRVARSAPTVPATHSTAPAGPAVVAYQALVSRDDANFNRAIAPAASSCQSFAYEACVRSMSSAKAALEQFKSDLAAAQVPPQMADLNAQLLQGIQGVEAAVDNQIAAATAGDAKQVEANGYAFGTASIPYHKAMTGVGCWPAGVHDTSTDGGFPRYACVT